MHQTSSISAAGSERSDPGELRINAERLQRRLAQLGAVGALPDGGCSRLALSDDDRRGRDLVVDWMRDANLNVRVDAIGNVIGERPGRAGGPAVMTGSHIDTVATGGLYDGNLGVLAGLEVIETLNDAGVDTHRPIAVGFFTNEEGARFQPDMLGSLVYVGAMSVDTALDVIGIGGRRLGDELAGIGYAGNASCPGPRPHAFVELHIEQGPVMEEAGVTIGAVTGVQGISWQELTITGRSAHAGTTPLRLRRDPGYVAMEIGAFVRRLCQEFGGAQVGTVGRLTLTPNLINVVPSEALLTVDLRHTDEDVLQQAEARLAAFCEGLAAAEGVTISSRSLARFAPVQFDPAMIDLVEATAQRLGNSTMRLASGAGHDAQMMARVCPTAMIFVPSVGGISHNITEFTEAADVAAGADVLLATVVHLAEAVHPAETEQL